MISQTHKYRKYYGAYEQFETICLKVSCIREKQGNLLMKTFQTEMSAIPTIVSCFISDN